MQKNPDLNSEHDEFYSQEHLRKTNQTPVIKISNVQSSKSSSRVESDSDNDDELNMTKSMNPILKPSNANSNINSTNKSPLISFADTNVQVSKKEKCK